MIGPGSLEGCQPCPADTYRPLGGYGQLEQCTACPSRMGTWGADARTHISHCRCQRSYYRPDPHGLLEEPPKSTQSSAAADVSDAEEECLECPDLGVCHGGGDVHGDPVGRGQLLLHVEAQPGAWRGDPSIARFYSWCVHMLALCIIL